jgi:carbon storage regulator
MLVLRRKLGSFIVINDNVVVHVLEVHDGRVKLGIEAPKEVSIRRGEQILRDDAARRNREYVGD